MNQPASIRARQEADRHYHEAVASGVERGQAADEAERVYRSAYMESVLDYYGASDPSDI